MILLWMFFACIIFVYWWKRPHSKFPPGPRGLPLLGILPFIKDSMQETVKEWSETKYGPIMSARVGREDTVFLNTSEAIRKVFVKFGSISSGRSLNGIFHEVYGNHGITDMDYSETFLAQKQFGSKCLRKKRETKGIEEVVDSEVEKIVHFFRCNAGQPIHLAVFFKRFTANIVSKFVFNTRYSYDDNSENNIITLIEKSNTQSGILLLCVFFKALRYFPPFSTACTEFLKSQNAVLDAIENIVQDHEKNFDEKDLRDFVDDFLHEQKHGDGKQKSSFTRRQLLAYCHSLFIAGTETSSITLSWCFLCLLHYPKYQEIMFKEINGLQIEEGTKLFSLKHEMVFTHAFLQEVMRYRAGAPFSVPHKANETIEVDGYVIPKGTPIFSNLHAAQNDPQCWENPELFRPERFIKPDGSFDYSKKTSLFGVGPRSCIGEILAKYEVFTMFAKVLQLFEVMPVPDTPIPSLDENFTTLFFAPKPYTVLLRER